MIRSLGMPQLVGLTSPRVRLKIMWPTGIDHDNVMLVIVVQTRYKISHLAEREVRLIQSEHPAVMHIINICLASEM